MTAQNSQQNLLNAYREVVINLAGVFSVHDVADDIVWAVYRSLDRVFERRLIRDPVATPGPTLVEPRRRPHPAMLEILATLDRHAPSKDQPLGSDANHEAPAEDEFIRLPGIFRRWEIEQVLEGGTDFHLEEAGNAADGTSLYAVYRREHNPIEEA